MECARAHRTSRGAGAAFSVNRARSTVRSARARAALARSSRGMMQRVTVISDLAGSLEMSASLRGTAQERKENDERPFAMQISIDIEIPQRNPSNITGETKKQKRQN